jgi:hypothetical protein
LTLTDLDRDMTTPIEIAGARMDNARTIEYRVEPYARLFFSSSDDSRLGRGLCGGASTPPP